LSASEAKGTPRVYRRPVSPAWWIRNGHYFWYVVREFTSVPLALWLLWLLYDIRQAGVRPASFHPPTSPVFVAFSVVVLLFALYHSVTFLSLSGLIIRVKVIDRPLPARLITLAMFGTWLVVSVVIAFVLVWFAR
jgi:fumarate reductase subunit C